jgi:hypothetical protein
VLKNLLLLVLKNLLLLPPPPFKMVATFDNYTAELDDGSNVLIRAHDIDVYIDRQKGIQVAELIGKFSENLLMGFHQKAKYMWYNRRIHEYIEIGVNSQPNLDVALDKYGTDNHILFLGNITTRADPEYGLTEGNGNMPSSIRDLISPSKVDTRKKSPKNTAKVTLIDTLKWNRKLLCKKTSSRKNTSAQSRAEWLMTTKGENTRKKSTRKKTTEENTQSTTKKTTEETTPNKSTTKKTTEETTPNNSTTKKTTKDKTPKMSTTKKTTEDKTLKMSTTKKTTEENTPKMSTTKKYYVFIML